ncbi:Hypothetical protein A7982_02449 [Minicystis rosea]|nr:Hypothetical protein A7982_02449 [Minicystis rosea]
MDAGRLAWRRRGRCTVASVLSGCRRAPCGCRRGLADFRQQPVQRCAVSCRRPEEAGAALQGPRPKVGERAAAAAAVVSDDRQRVLQQRRGPRQKLARPLHR